jgi:hypothetical protein
MQIDLADEASQTRLDHSRGILMNPLLSLNQRGQFVWLDHISRDLITGGGLQRLISEDGLGGVTSNPTISTRPSRKVPITMPRCVAPSMPTATSATERSLNV